jgi:hypothetical protein
MPPANLVCSTNAFVHPGSGRTHMAGVEAPRECRSAAERILKEAAYVCHLTRSVRQSMTGRQGKQSF